LTTFKKLSNLKLAICNLKSKILIIKYP
jgi:hypothetical protein